MPIFDRSISSCGERVFYALLIVMNILFMTYWIILSSNYCLHFDDAHFMWKAREYSLFEYVGEMYETRGGNFVGYSINWFVCAVSNILKEYRFWPILFYIFGVYMTYYSVKGLILGHNKWTILLFVISFYNIYVLTIPDYAIFTWLCAMSYYLYAPAMSVLVRNINKPNLNTWNWAAIILLITFLSGSNISITPLVWIIFLVNILYINRKENHKVRLSFENAVSKRIFYLSLFSLAIYIIMFAAPGNFNRLETGTDMCHPNDVFQFVTAWMECIVMFLYFMAFYIPYHILFVIFGVAIGHKLNLNVKTKYLIYVVLAFAIYLGISVIPLAYLSNGFGIQRNYTHITFFYLVMLLLIGVIIGSKYCIAKILNYFGIAFASLLIIIMAINISIDTPKVVAYRKAHQVRESLLLSLKEKKNRDMIYVDPFPSTATTDAKSFILSLIGNSAPKQTIFYESDTGKQPDEYENYIKHLYDLDFDFVLY